MRANKTEPAWNWLVPTTAMILGLAVAISASFLSSAMVKIKSQSPTLSVTGAAYEPIVSDFAHWTGFLKVNDSTIKAAYAALEKAVPHVKRLIVEHGFAERDIAVSAVSVREIMDRNRQVVGYELKQSFRVETEVIEKVTLLAQNASSLLERGIQFQSRSPSYLFTGLDGLKLKMIQAATKNALVRAKMLAEATGGKVGELRRANVGVFQVRPRHSQEVSSYGISDEGSIEKEIVSTVHATFRIE